MRGPRSTPYRPPWPTLKPEPLRNLTAWPRFRASRRPPGPRASGSASVLRETALKYREARLTAAPHIPADLVTGEEVEEIDEQLTAAERVVSEMQERMEKERRQESPPIPAGSPVRRAPDYSGLPAAEKFKLGLQHLSD